MGRESERKGKELVWSATWPRAAVITAQSVLQETIDKVERERGRGGRARDWEKNLEGSERREWEGRGIRERRGGIWVLFLAQSRLYERLWEALDLMKREREIEVLEEAYIEGSKPEWCISSMIYRSRDAPFWLETLDTRCYMTQVCSDYGDFVVWDILCECVFVLIHACDVCVCVLCVFVCVITGSLWMCMCVCVCVHACVYVCMSVHV